MKINIDLIYPIGSIYLTTSTVNPSTLFGGTWVRWGNGRVPVGVDSAQSEFESVEKTGGSKFMQNHYHDVRFGSPAGAGVSISNAGEGQQSLVVQSWSWNDNILNAKGSTSNLATNTEGTGDSENLQPYITCYMWKRTA